VELTRRPPARSLISLVPLVDVLLIMLVFFMVTSTYLDLDMIPAVERAEEEAAEAAAAPGAASGALLIRLAPDGRAWLRGRPLSEAELRAVLAERAAAGPAGEVSVLASPRAEVQALVALMDLAADTGLARLRVLRTEAGP